MYKLANKIIVGLPYVGRLKLEIETLKSELKKNSMWKPPGHFYSPIPSIAEIKKDADRIFSEEPLNLNGIDINESGQLEHLNEFKQYYAEIPFKSKKTNQYRYYYDNPYYSYADGITLYCMLRFLRPRKIIEVGSGYSSALMLDVNDQFFNGEIKFDFIEPYPERLNSLLTKDDRKNVKIYSQRVQDVPRDVFDRLNNGDVLFVDSSHVSKIGSDVNYLLFDILPNLKSGVYIHFHDIFYPFEYPRSWVYEGVAWNEAYALRAFLQYNDAFKIEFFISYLLKLHRKAVIDAIPLALNSETAEISLSHDAPGANIWLRKL
jgi:predicted O-methyltransferase YrrM